MGKKPQNSQLTTGFVIAAASLAAPLLAGSGTENGQPFKTFVKDVIRCGDWQTAAGVKFSVTPERLDGWVSQFNAMQATGIKVPIPDGHTFDADKNLGWVTGMFRDGDTLKAQMKLIGDDAVKAAARNDVSIYVPKEISRGDGKTFADAIEHIALTPVPQIPGLGPFVEIAASAGGQPQKVPVLRLATESTMTPLQQIAQALGIDPTGMDDAALLAACMQKIQGQAATAKTALDAQVAKVTQLTAQVTALEAAKGKPIEVDPDVIDQAVENVELGLSGLVKDKHITQAAADALKPILLGADAASRPAIMLSGKAATVQGFTKGVAKLIIEALTKNDGKALALTAGERTGPQRLALSRTEPGDGKGDKSDDTNPDIAALSAKAYGVKTSALATSAKQ